LQSNFFSGSGTIFEFGGNTIPTVGSADAFIGGSAELNDFIEATYTGTGITNLNTGELYGFDNVSITAAVPAPSTRSLIGVGFLAARRRRVG